MENQYLQTAIDAAKSGGEILMKYWGKKIEVRQKSFAWDLVTQADKESEDAILSLIRERHSEHEILSEEAGLDKRNKSEFLWVVDPLDGTTNYTHQYPMFCVSIALYQNNQPLVGVIFNPLHNELFSAVKGKGAHLNGEPISVSYVDTLERSLLVTGFAYNRRKTTDNNYAEFCHLTHLSQGVRRGGSAALDLAYIATGRLDGFWEQGLKPWDVAAGRLLVEEAGGKVSSYKETTFDIYAGVILATNGVIHEDIHRELLNARRV